MSNSPSKVNSGPPIWLWLILVPLTLAVIAGLYINSIPPDLEKAYQEAVTALDDRTGKELFEEKLAVLEGVPEYENHVRYLKGRLATNQQRVPKALKLFAEVPDDSPLKPEVDRRIGDAYRQIGEFKKSIEAYRRSVDADPEGGLDARMNLASLYLFAGALDLASVELDKNLKLDPTHEDSHIMRANLRITREDYEKAKEDFEAVLDAPGKFSSTPPHFVTAYFQCLIKLKEKEKLKELAKAHLGVISDPPLKSSVLSEIGEYREAMLSLQGAEGAVTQDPNYKQAQLKLLLLEENNVEAGRLANELIALFPRNLDVLKLASQTFAATEETELKARVDENIQQILKLKEQLNEAIAKVSQDVTNGPGRAEVARLYRELADYQKMDSWFRIAQMLDSSLSAEYEAARGGEGFPKTPLVPFEAPAEEKQPTESDNKKQPEDEAPKEDQDKTDQADKPKADSKPADTKPEPEVPQSEKPKENSDEEEKSESKPEASDKE